MNLTRSILVVVLHVLAWLVFGIGLLSPLTPSEGTPRALDLGVFVAGPVVLLTGALAVSRRFPSKGLAILGIGAIVAAAGWLLRLQQG